MAWHANGALYVTARWGTALSVPACLVVLLRFRAFAFGASVSVSLGMGSRCRSVGASSSKRAVSCLAVARRPLLAGNSSIDGMSAVRVSLFVMTIPPTACLVAAQSAMASSTIVSMRVLTRT
ncbi:hypothetical protein TSOC_013217 [Tetrabaena socialis]|uniref:Uncharacterized protein n=1 Tax=Tetrabaena socialis TaxID=47790 RepID=A0A2J7ZKZ5_9CHLO|nr:hypothetical protein TSOC_013217 [Tetrabaena socialis]|eukprot:PNH00931.1 hypothetical protein TSOC_013217 [Tetrabaena socialis]